MNTTSLCRGLGLTLLWVSTATAQDQVIKLTGKPYIDMDYGAFLTASIEVSAGNIAQKGIAVRLDDGPGGVSQGNAFVLFDTDTMRVAGGDWSLWSTIYPESGARALSPTPRRRSKTPYISTLGTINDFTRRFNRSCLVERVNITNHFAS